MKKILVSIFLLKVFCLEASSMINKAMQHIPEIDKGLVSHATRPISGNYLENLALKYWKSLKDGDGQFFNLITDKTKIEGYRPLGLTGQDINFLQNLIKDFLVNGNFQIFGVKELPAWLSDQYQAVNPEILSIIARDEKYNFLGPDNIRLAVLEYIFQKHFFYIVKNRQNKAAIFAQVQKEAIDFLSKSVFDYEYLGSIRSNGRIESLHVIVRPQDFAVQENLDLLKDILEDNLGPKREIVIAFDDSVTQVLDNLVLPNLIKDLVKNIAIIGISLRSIGYNFLKRHKSIKRVAMSDGITQIEGDFFVLCVGLENIRLSQGLEKIGGNFLRQCSNLKKLQMADDVTEVGDNFLYGCTKLENIRLSKGLKKIGKNFLYECFELKELQMADRVTNIGDYFLYKCKNLETIRLSQRLEKIGIRFFWKCSELRELEMSDSVTEVGDGFLGYCTKLETIRLSQRLEKIGDYFLLECSELKTLEIPDSVTDIKKFFLWGCKKLRELMIKKELFEKVGGYSYFKKDNFPVLTKINHDF